MGDGLVGNLQFSQPSQHEMVRGVDRADDFLDAQRVGPRAWRTARSKAVVTSAPRALKRSAKGWSRVGGADAFHGREQVFFGFDRGSAPLDVAMGAAYARIERRGRRNGQARRRRGEWCGALPSRRSRAGDRNLRAL